MTQLSQLRKSGAFAVAFFARVLIRATFVLGTTLVVIWLLTTPAQAEQRVALLIGNAAYQSSPLSNPPNDVREMEAALKAVGFKVDKVLNANQNTMKRAVRDFGDKAQGADIAQIGRASCRERV